MYAVWQGILVEQKIEGYSENGMLEEGRKVWAGVDAGVDGFVLTGRWDTENGPQLLATALEQVGGMVPVIVGIAGRDATDAVAQAKMAEQYDVDGLIVSLPAHLSGEAAAFFKTVAAATNLPIMIDNREGVGTHLLEELFSCKTIQAVKGYTGDMTAMADRWANRYRVLCGDDRVALEGLMTGALGWIVGAVGMFPAEAVAVYRLICAGRRSEAMEIYQWLMEMGRLLERRPELPDYLALAGAVA